MYVCVYRCMNRAETDGEVGVSYVNLQEVLQRQEVAGLGWFRRRDEGGRWQQ